jgi:16S rRNA (guanine966-N2)-methyltransferase
VAADVESSTERLARRSAHAPFDLVLADPPWARVDSGHAARVLAELAAAGGLAADATVVLEHAARTPSPEVAGLERTDARRYGDTALTFYKPAILAAHRPVSRDPLPE